MVSVQELLTRTVPVDVYREVRRARFGPGDFTAVCRVVADLTVGEEVRLEVRRQQATAAGDETARAQVLAEIAVRVLVSWDLILTPGGPVVPLAVGAIRADVPPEMLEDLLTARNARLGRAARSEQWRSR